MIEEIGGTDLKENEKEQLLNFYNEFLAIYSSIIEQKLIPKRNLEGKMLPTDLSDIKANIKYKYSSEA